MKRPPIEGWTSDAEAAELARLAAGKTVLEVGAFKGFGTVLMAQAGAKVWAVDWHRGDADLGPRDTLCAWWTNVRRHHVEDQVVGLVGRSEIVLPLLQPFTFDLAFIDGWHHYQQVQTDAGWAQLLVKPGGLLVFHDYDPKVWPGVVRAVNDLQAAWVAAGHQSRDHGWRLVGSLAILRTEDSLSRS